MITRLVPTDKRLGVSQIGGHPLLGTAIAARALCPQQEMEFWLCEGTDTMAWLSRQGNTLYLTGGGDIDELATFATTLGCATVLTDLVLPLGEAAPMTAVQWQGEPPILPELPHDCRIVYLTPYSSRLSAVDFARFQLLCGAFATGDEADGYAVSLSHAVRHECAAATAIIRGGQIIAGAAVNQVARGSSVLGSVAVHPSCRRQGLATAVAQIGAALSMQLAARPYLCCRAKLRPLYEGAGFAVIAPLHQYRKDN